MRIVTWWKTRLWWVRWITYTVTVIVLFYGIEDFRGYRALEKAKAEYLAAGLRLDIDEILGPRIPDDENFAASEIIREAYADAERSDNWILSGLDLPEIPAHWKFEKYRGFRGSMWTNQDQESKEKYDGEGRRIIRKLAPEITRYFEAAARPHCDWSVVTDPTDYRAKNPRFSLMLQASQILEFYDSTHRLGRVLPVSRAEVISGNLSVGRHLRTNQNLVLTTIGKGISSQALATLSEHLQNGLLSTANLELISQSLDKLRQQKAERIVEFEAAVFMQRTGYPPETRKLFIEKVKAGNCLVSLPSPFSFELDLVERWLNIGVIEMIPRGWIWQGKARVMRCVLGKRQSSPFKGYTLFLYGDGDYLESPIRQEEQFQVSLQLASVAIEIEKHRLTTGSLPTGEQFNTNSPNIGYTIEKNGQPMLWYSEKLPLCAAPTGKLLEAYEERYLWRYPPSED